jgi:light-regulated signal transduction histidine kinase (bacteriophytochrome)
VADATDQPINLFPRRHEDPVEHALLRAPTMKQLEEMRAAGLASTLRVPVMQHGEAIGAFHCHNRAPRTASLELHAAAELFAQVFGMLLPRRAA